MFWTVPGRARPSIVEVWAPARIHVTAIAGAGGRMDGGVGFAVDAPAVRLAFQDAERFACAGAADPDESEMVAAEVKEAAAALGFPDAVHVRVRSVIPAGRGFGAHTQLRLAVWHGLAELNGKRPAHDELAAHLGPCGVAGIGAHLFRHGGIVVNGGRLDVAGAEGCSLPPTIYATRPFDHWRLVIAVPRIPADQPTIVASGRIQPSELHEVSHIVLMTMLPALADGDLRAFGRTLTRLQDVGRIRRYWARPALRHWRAVLDALIEAGAAGGGLSRTGPALYAVYDATRVDGAELLARTRAHCERLGIELESLGTAAFAGPARVDLPTTGADPPPPP
jgi:beta-ribofuranosylaminobenzene 5'-phosphate synthase